MLENQNNSEAPVADADVSAPLDVPTPQEVPAEAPKHKENQLLGIVLSVEGPVEIRWIEGKRQHVFPQIESLAPFSKKFKKNHAVAFRHFSDLVQSLRATKGRQLPVLREEALQIMTKQEFKDLEHLGFIKSQLVQVENKTQKLGGRVAAWMTPQGRALDLEVRSAIAEKVKLAQQNKEPEFGTYPESEALKAEATT